MFMFGVCVGGLMGEYVITCGCGYDTGVGVWIAEHSDEASACSRTLLSVTSDRHKFPNSHIPVTQKIILMYRKFPSRCLLFYRDWYGSWTCGNEFERLRVGEKKCLLWEAIKYKYMWQQNIRKWRTQLEKSDLIESDSPAIAFQEDLLL